MKMFCLLLIFAQMANAVEVQKEFTGTVTIERGDGLPIKDVNGKPYQPGTYGAVLITTYDDPSLDTKSEPFKFNTKSILKLLDSGATMDIKGMATYDDIFGGGHLVYNGSFAGSPKGSSLNETLVSKKIVSCEMPTAAPYCHKVGVAKYDWEHKNPPACQYNEIAKANWVSTSGPGGSEWTFWCCDKNDIRGTQEIQTWTHTISYFFDETIVMEHGILRLNLKLAPFSEEYVNGSYGTSCEKK